ncbi:hypothetical protein JI664_03510 [Rhodobacter sp. NTK016B]|uniref:hypothetical protein n=1 Tax=Rhodobacter sp. NTK016B TaxID=2759676 RepID=UPI001A8D16DC|nr:hypothetical protein [Rhodobacter sp. NTK016B]MBN8291024.1 hypothetical protein [Rhodobacter sp. NTK016B]
MPAQTNHPSFPQPVEPTLVWRFMDLPRYLDIAARGRLFFSRQDKFRDTFEGEIPRLSRYGIAMQFRESEAKQLKENPNIRPNPGARALEGHFLDYLRNVRRENYISCWHMNSAESAAMWDLFGRDGSAIAFKTSYQRFRDCLPDYAYLGMVNYIDFDKQFFDLKNVFNPAMHKRKSFEHEKEIRAVINKFPNEFYGFDSDEAFSAAHELTDFGLTIPFDVNACVEEILIGPDAPPWFERMIKETNAKLSIETPVRKSALYDVAAFRALDF